MTVEAQLRSVAEAASAEQRPVTAEEVLARATDRYVLDVRSDRRSWTLVAATIALLVGGLVALFAWDRAPDTGPQPVASTPETVSPATTDPSIPMTPGAAPVEVLVNEPTLEYRTGVQWWAPGQLPVGWRYGYAADEGAVQTVRVFADDGPPIDIEFGAELQATEVLSGNATIEELGDATWEVFEDGLAREVDGRLLAIIGPVEPSRQIAAGLELVPETDLARPPFRADAEPGPVVLTLPAAEVGGSEPFELRAHTDGLFTTVGGDIKRVSAEDPVGFGDYVYDLSGDAESYRVVLTGVALSGLERIEFGLLAGDVGVVTPTASERFAEDFYALVIDVPAALLEQYEQGTLARLTRWTLTHVDGEQRVYDEPGAENCVNCEDIVGSGERGSVLPVPGQGLPLEFEPTNTYGDELWWIPTQVPDGYEFEYALQLWGLEGGHTVVYRSTGSEGSQFSVEQRSAADAVGAPPPTAEELAGGVAWSWSGDDNWGELSRVIDERRVSVSGDRQVVLAAAAVLELVPESRLERPPFRPGDDLTTSVVVTTAPNGDDELRASTDGVAVSLNGSQPPLVPSNEPLTLAGGGAECSDDVCVVRLFGATSPDVASVDVERLDGGVVTVVPEDLSGRFGGIKFFVVEIEIPAVDDDFSSFVESIVARNADGQILSAINEPI